MPTGADFSGIPGDPPFALPPSTAQCPDWRTVPMYLMSGMGTQANPFVPMPGVSAMQVPKGQPPAPAGWYRLPAGGVYAWHVPWYVDGSDQRFAPITSSGTGGAPERPFPSLDAAWAVMYSPPVSVYEGSLTFLAPPLSGAYFMHRGDVLFLQWPPTPDSILAGTLPTVTDARGNARLDVPIPALLPGGGPGESISVGS